MAFAIMLSLYHISIQTILNRNTKEYFLMADYNIAYYLEEFPQGLQFITNAGHVNIVINK